MQPFVSGTYREHREYKSFSPTRIQKLSFDWKTDSILRMLGEADRFLGELNASSEFVPDVDFFIKMHIAKEATTSSHIEGTKTRIDEVFHAAKHIDPEKRDDWQEVQNYIRAMNASIKQLKTLPLSMRMIKNAHKILLSGVRGHGKAPGAVRKSQNWIGGASLRTARFIPPSHSELPELLSDLEMFWHRDDLPHLIQIAIGHYQFETIHPFLDGNGRTGRMIITLHLVALGILSRPTLYLSDFFDQHRAAYFDALMAVRTNHDINHWIEFFLEGVIQTSQKGKQTFASIVKLRKEYEHKLCAFKKRAPVYQRLLYQLFRHPVMTPGEVEAFLGVVPSTANRMLQALEKMDILQQTSTTKRNRSYALHAYIDLFTR